MEVGLAVDDYWEAVRTRWSRSTVLANVDYAASVPNHFKVARNLNIFAPPRIPLAVTGMRGAGKTTLHKALRGRLTIGQSEDRLESPKKEAEVILARTPSGKRRFQLVVIPGQKDSLPGQRAVNAHFKGGRFPLGVIHVVSWGYSKIWDAESARSEIDALPVTAGESHIDRVRKYNLELELGDFRLTRELLQDCWQDRNPAVWLIIAVAKVDLFRGDLSEAGRYYLPASNPNHDSEFAKELRGFVNFLGEGLMRRLAVLPVSSLPERYAHGNSAIESSGDFDLSSRLAVNLSNTIGDFCGLG